MARREQSWKDQKESKKSGKKKIVGLALTFYIWV